MSLDEAVRRAAPITDDELDALMLDAVEAELREAIVTRPVRRRAPRRRRRLVPAAGALVAAALAATIVFLSGSGGGTDRAWAAQAVRVAEAVPRLLIDGWTVTRADQFDVGTGEMQFENGVRRAELSWRRDQSLAGWVRDRGKSTRALADHAVLGTTARVFEYSPRDQTALWTMDGYVLELRGPGVEELLGRLRAVSVDVWLSAMPASVVRPGSSDRVIDEMLVDLPVPPGFDRAALDTHGAPRDRYQLGARVVAAVSCGWIKTWLEGAARERTAAVQALRAVERSAVLKAMNREGHYGEVLHQHVEAVATDGTVVGGKALTVAESYKDALGC
ncbi:hypothetical protein C8N24_1958 [Solirubrobacter pauli]|uniref:Uncharacterized protein n=1 Tax=Solirubrobacter pauli TaxID=166793 RepID=A0A660LC10_9ACTN|nr:hypothetical protein [Solirubrobacter pauli]RKQ92119.1 hypothetical protein C8N24_1958 [Solirubrobacter pauli]